MKIGYARCSTVDQEAGMQAQLRDLETAGCERVFSEKISGTVRERPQLATAMSFLRPGDELVVTKIDRLARNLAHLIDIANKISESGASLIVINLGVDTATPTGAMMMNILGAVAQFERDMMHERQREGIAHAKANGKYRNQAKNFGKKPGESGPRGLEKSKYVKGVLQAFADGVRPFHIGPKVGCSRATVYRILSEAGMIEKKPDQEPTRRRATTVSMFAPGNTRKEQGHVLR